MTMSVLMPQHTSALNPSQKCLENPSLELNIHLSVMSVYSLQ